MNSTLGARITTTEITVATITAREDGTSMPSSHTRAVRPGESLGAAFSATLDRLPDTFDHIVADLSPILDTWLLPPTPPHADTSSVGRVTVVRVAPSAKTIAEPYDGWPPHLRERLDGGWVHLTGGVDLHGGGVVSNDTTALDDAVRLADKRGSVAICVSAMGALLDSDVEYEAAEHLLRVAPHQRVLLAHETGGRRFLEREKAALLSASLLPATATLLDKLEIVARQAGSTLSLAAADGSRLAVEDARRMPVRLLGSTNALVAQGSAALVGTSTAVVLVWVDDHARLLTIEDGVLRTRLVRHSARLGDLRFAQRHAAESILGGPAVAALTRDLVDTQPMIVTNLHPCETTQSQGFDDLATALLKLLPDAHVVQADPQVLAALGARASLPQSEIIRYAVLSHHNDVERVRRILRHLAQGRVLAAADGPVELRTLADHHAPLSFLTVGPVLLRTHVVGFPTENT